MSWKIDTAGTNGIVVIKAEGAVSFFELMNRAGDADGCVSLRRAERILMDFLDEDAETADLDLYILPIFYEELHLDRNTRIASVLPESHVKYGVYQSYAEMSRQRGYNLSIFTSRTQALEWLGRRLYRQDPSTLFRPAAVVVFGPLSPVTGERR